MSRLVLIVALIAVVSFVSASADEHVRRQKRQSFSNCRNCEVILNMAHHYFGTNPNVTKEQLQAQLMFECQILGNQESAAAGAHCTQVVTDKMDTIYTDVQAGKRPRQTCEDIQECPHIGK